MDEHCLPLYRWACPNCERTTSSERLRTSMPCQRCLPSPTPSPVEDPTVHRNYLVQKLRQLGTFRPDSPLGRAAKVDEDLLRFRTLFQQCVGAPPWHIQETWARRVIEGRSFALIAPTGIGKTTFGALMALHRVYRAQGKAVILLPTISLAQQVSERVQTWLSCLPGEGDARPPRVLALHSGLPAKQRREARQRLEQGDADILVITAAFLRRPENVRLVRGLRPSFVFVDDVDAVLKSGRIVDGVLAVLGLDGKTMDMVQELLRLRRRMATVSNPQRRANIWKQYQGLRQRVQKRIEGRILVVSSATGQPRGRRVLLFREIFGFEIGGKADIARNITDVAWVGPEEQLMKQALHLLPLLGSGGLIFVPRDMGIEGAQEVAEAVQQHTSLRCGVFTTGKHRVLEAFAVGELDILVGVASPYGVMVRGLDLPERIRYALFVHAPRHVLPLSLDAQTPLNLIRLLALISEVAPEPLAGQIRSLVLRLRHLLQRYPSLAAAEGLERFSPSSPVRKTVEEATRALQAFLDLPDMRERLFSHPYILVREHQGRLLVYVPDWSTYIQASGRTSRLFVGGITHGLSLVLESEARLLRGLERRLSMRLGEFEFLPLEDVDLVDVLRQIDEDRERLQALRTAHALPHQEWQALARTTLIIVESPNKARTIAHFFGRPGVQEINGLRVYETSIGNINLLIAASGGHVYDLIVDEAEEERAEYPFSSTLHGVGLNTSHFFPLYTSIKRCLQCGYQFTDERPRCPTCGSTLIRDTRDVIAGLRKLALEVDEIYIATDPDTEGEKIAFDLTLLLAPLHPRIRRMEFHEVTPRAIRQALEQPRSLNDPLVAAQIVRRVDDRWLGFTLSQKVSAALGKGPPHSRPRLSAGRVQTPVLGWIIQRYKEHEQSKEPHLILHIPFAGEDLRLHLPHHELTEDVHVGDTLDVRVRVAAEEEQEWFPRPPYTTDTLIYDAVRHLKIDASRVMQLAQNLFEWGLITYHRTDSVHVAPEGIRIAQEYLNEYAGGRLANQFHPRAWGEEGAHEAIRPTRPVDARTLRGMITEGLMTWSGWTEDHLRVYDLIFRRFIASQMAPVSVMRQFLKIRLLRAERIVWEGEVEWPVLTGEESFLHFYSYGYNVHRHRGPSETEVSLSISVDEHALKVLARVPLFTAGDVVRLMKERGIGRPSTYHKVVDTLLRRRYVRTSTGGVLIPSSRGEKVYTFLATQYGSLVSEQATRTLEMWMDAVVAQELTCGRVLHRIWENLKAAGLIGKTQN